MSTTLLSFSAFLTEEKNTHMTHIEDLVLYSGVEGTKRAILTLRDLRNTLLSGKAKPSRAITVKWDGAPAVFCGLDPSDGKFFVAKKGIFNKNPKVYKTEAEIDEDIPNPELASKMKLCLKELPALNIKGVIQGDMMFSKSDLKKQSIDGKNYITFHPNTIVYAVEDGTPEAKEIKKANLGIVFHTSYSGPSFEEMKADYGLDISKLTKSETVWFQSADYNDYSGTSSLSNSEQKTITNSLNSAAQIFKKIRNTVLKDLEQNQALAQKIETYNNTLVRANKRISNTKKHVDGLIEFIKGKYQKEIDKLKTEKGKQKKTDLMNAELSFFSDTNKNDLALLFDLQNNLVDAKILIISKLSQLSKIGTFVLTNDGFRITKPEGYVAIDTLSNKAVKLVDRLEFSTNNFNPEIIKGWQR